MIFQLAKSVEDALRESEERYRILFADSPDSYLIIVDGVFVDCNRASEHLLRGSRSQIVGQSPSSISPEFQPNGRKSSDVAEELIKETFLTGKNTFDWVHRRLDGTSVDVNVSIASMVYKGKPAIFTAWRDITGRKRAEKAFDESNRKLEKLSITDGLTDLFNRRHFDCFLEIEFSRHLRTGVELSLIMLDIDYFKAFNDNYGHVNGDECLRKIARVMFNCASRPADLNARYGGEEFVCILPNTDLNGAITVAEKIRRGIMNLSMT